MRHFFVINPHSFRRKNDKLKQVLKDIENCFTGEKNYITYLSRYPRDAVAVIHRYMTKVPSGQTVRVYAVGGDGILFDCLNGMIDFPNAELTAVPYGSSNDYVRAFGEKANESFRNISQLCSAPSLPVDIINCGINYAINGVAFGLESQAVFNANSVFRLSSLKWLRNFSGLVYKFGGIAAIINNEVRMQKYNVLLDGEDLSGNYCNISVSNTPCIGGNLISNPYAKPTDGLLNAVFAKSGSVFTVMFFFGDYTSGQYEKNKAFFGRKFKKMEIQSDVPIRAHLDGETFYTKDLKLEIMPSRIKFIVPQGMDFKDYSYRAYK